MKRRVLAASLVVLAVIPGGATASVRGSPDLSVSVADDTVAPGTDTTIQVRVVNAGDLEDGSIQNPGLNDDVTTARGVQVSLDASDAPFEVETDSRSVGSLARGGSSTLDFRLSVPEDAEPGTYEIPVTVTYSYTGIISESTGGRATRETEHTFEVTIEVRETARFRVVGVDHDLAVGEAGDVSVTLRNAGPIAVSDASVELATDHADLRFGEAASASRYVGEWAPGETRMLTYRMTAADGAEPRSYVVSATVAYRDAEGDRETYRTASFGVTPGPEQTFAYRNVSVALWGSTARVTGEVVNTGDRRVTAALVTANSTAPRVRVTGGTHPVGTLEPGESARFGIGLHVAPNTHPGPRELGVSVRYERGGARTYASDASSITVPIRTDREDIAVTAVNNSLEIDASNTVRVRLHNTGDDRLTNVHARLAVEPPYDSESPSAYVASLAPGENTTVTFELTTPEDGVPTTDAVSLNVSAETPAGQRVTYGPYLVPVTTTTSGGPMGDVPVLGLGAVVVVALVAAGWWWFN
ncbi:MAG: CARDB domain-containing protein [Halorientalis sp.]